MQVQVKYLNSMNYENVPISVLCILKWNWSSNNKNFMELKNKNLCSVTD